MNLLDIVIVVAALSAAATGYQLGFIIRVASWAGGLLGVLVGVWAAPRVVEAVGGAQLIRLVLAVFVILGLGAVGASIAEGIGRSLRHGLHRDAASADRAGGAVAGVVGILVLVWLFAPVLAGVPGLAARQARESAIAGWVSGVTPRAPDPMQALPGVISDLRFPQVFTDLQAAPDTGPPPAAGGVSSETIAAVTRSTVNIEALGCGGIHEGSGFAVAANTVVTNAHVVAGARDVRVRRPDGQVRPAEVVVFDGDRDLAVLTVDGLGQAPLPISEAQTGAAGVVIGYPGGQNNPRVAPARIRQEAPTIGYDIYGRSRVRRQVLYLAADLARGDSGGALVNADGAVVGVAFAIAPDRRTTAYALDDSELRAVLAAPRSPTSSRCM